MKILKMGTRGSQLALAQARLIARQLEHLHPDLQVEEHIIRTTGDKNQGQPLPEIGGKGVFTLEIEDALLSGEIDFAVHSLKDLPPAMPEGLCLAAVPPRENPCDTLVLHDFNIPSVENGDVALKILPLGALVGTSSGRRAAMLRNLRPDLKIESVRGNIDTRIRKLHEEGFHAIVLARAGLTRAQIEPSNTLNLPESWFVPAPGQGALALQSRRDDLDSRAILMALEDAPTRAAIEAERAVVSELEAGCSTPLGVLARSVGDAISMHAVVLSPDGLQRIAVSVQGSGAPELIGMRAAKSLLEKGAREILG
ncbi:hydroxymethylbilane synthase [Abditibacterium utsteinense]|uniref:Porphobilinogen deaminase n=1 Tax=Abditibacterium utsteinense TaxID=1960156 RepID=A0A2S8SRP6_9BACT|nr:hydroxymethylbilane synthase [Abditibacterium utsteinense]PQV63481.1 hydroxymethylbilane synthase [Abditibacterium utsteinense]